MNILKKCALGLALAVSFSASAFADVTQTISHSGTDQFWYANSGYFTVGSITLAQGTRSISALSSAVTLKDQGWGYQDDGNGVYIGLFNGEQDIFNMHVAGAKHNWTTQMYNVANDGNAFSLLNAALGSINQDGNPALQLRMFTGAFGYRGWELHTRNDSFSVTSSISAVPEPETYGMMLAGLGLIGFLARRKAS